MKKRTIDIALELAASKGWNKSDFAREMNQSPQSVTNWQDRGMPYREVSRAADVLGVSVDQLLGRKQGGGKPPRQVPVISYVRAGAWNEASDPFEPGDAESWAFTTREIGANGFALRVEGDSMTSATGKTFPEGCIVIVHPGMRDPIDRQFVVAKLLGRDAVTFKQFRRDELGRVWLQPLNPVHEPIREEFSILGTVVQKVEDV